MPSVQRHTQVIAGRLKSISSADAERIFEDKAIDRSKLSYLIQTGSAQLGTTRYVTFPTSFADTPSVTLTRLGSIDMSAYGPISGSAPLEGIHQIVSGSFLSYATPTSYYMYEAIGSA
jgi:hypothetical protein